MGSRKKYSICHLSALLICLGTTQVYAEDITEQYAEVEALKASVLDKENSLSQSQAQLQAQSDKLQCLGERLQGYSTCELQQSSNVNTTASLSDCLAAVRQTIACDVEDTDNTLMDSADPSS